MIYKLESRGIVVDHSYAHQLFKYKNYYRFLPYIKYPTCSANAPSSLDLFYIEKRYKFDKKLRSLLFESTESIENFARHDVAEYFRTTGFHFYNDFLNPSNVPISTFPTTSLIVKIDKIFNKGNSEALIYYKTTHFCTIQTIPLWVLLEELDFGTTIWLIQELKKFDDSTSARNLIQLINLKYGLTFTVYISCLKSSKALRNYCAHGSRLYKSHLNADKPKFPTIWRLFDSHGNCLDSTNTVGLYRKMIGLKVFYKNRQDIWIEFLLTLMYHFDENPDVACYEDYYFHANWENILADSW